MALENAYAGVQFGAFDLNKIKADIELARKLNQTSAQSPEIQYVLETADVKTFFLPIVIGDDVYVDAKSFTGIDKTGELKIRNPVEHALRLDQARWELTWKRANGNLGMLMAQLPYHHEVYSKWISDALTHLYALTPYQCGQIQALAALFSVGQFYNLIEDQTKAYRLQELLSKELNLGMGLFESVTGNTEYLFPRNIDEFVEMITLSEISSRLKDVTRLSLTQAVATSFFGVGYDRQLCASAVEYPPSLLVIIKACLDNSMFNRSRLGSLIKKSTVARKKDKFEQTYNTILNQYTKPVNIQ